MLTVRKSHERGHANHGWLDSYHTFSFAGYRDPAWMGFGPLRVINDDRIAPGAGFPTHSHSDMEIVTWVLSGALEHKDSLGNGGVIRPGEAQRMRAGHGIAHSEYNASATEPVHLLQIWIEPDTYGLKPGYEQVAFPPERLRGQLQLIASQDGRDGSVTIHRTGFYSVEYRLSDLSEVAAKTKVMPDTFLQKDRPDITNDFLIYLRPLLGSGFPESAVLRMNRVPKILHS